MKSHVDFEFIIQLLVINNTLKPYNLTTIISLNKAVVFSYTLEIDGFNSFSCVSVNSKPDHPPPPPGRPPEIRMFSLPRGGVFAQLSLPGGVEVLNWRNFLQF